MKRKQLMTDRAALLENELILAQWSSLKNQVNPHFLFNNLSVLSSLVRVDPALSEKFIEHLSRTFRYILDQRDQELVVLRNEVNFIISYGFLLKIRFSEKFDLRIQLQDEDLDKCKIPPLTLQILMENAVRHNRMSHRQPLVVEMSREGNIVVIRNELQPRHVPCASTGMGLQNIINRYALLTDQPVWAGETDHHFVVKVPLLF